MSYRLHFILVLFFDLSSATTARYAYNSGELVFVFLSMLSLAGAGYFFIKLMEDEVGILVNALWIALGAINVTVASYFLFDEKISLLQGLGMAFVVTGLILTQVYAPSPSTEVKKNAKNTPEPGWELVD